MGVTHHLHTCHRDFPDAAVVITYLRNQGRTIRGEGGEVGRGGKFPFSIRISLFFFCFCFLFFGVLFFTPDNSIEMSGFYLCSFSYHVFCVLHVIL